MFFNMFLLDNFDTVTDEFKFDRKRKMPMLILGLMMG